MSNIKGQKKANNVITGAGETTPATARAAALARLDALIKALIEWAAYATCYVGEGPASRPVVDVLANLVWLQSTAGSVSNLFYIAEALTKVGAAWSGRMFAKHAVDFGPVPSGEDTAISVASAHDLAECSRLVLECIEVGKALSRASADGHYHGPVDLIRDLRGCA